jgi:ABC-type polysaccharide/polyol phosphate export permease
MLKFLYAFKNYNNLIWQLLNVNLIVQYKKSYVSTFWIVFNPLFQVIIWSILHFSGFVNPGDVKMPYLLYLTSGMTLWWFSFYLYENISTIFISNAGMILDNQFPKEVLIIECIIRQCIYYFFNLLFVILTMILYKVDFSFMSLLLPFFMLPLIFLSVALGMFFSVIRILALDIAMAFDKFLSLVLFFTPVLYAYQSGHPIMKNIIRFNPYSYMITLPRNILILGTCNEYKLFFITLVISIILLILSVAFFHKAENKVVEKIFL